MPEKKDLTGLRFGKLVVLEEDGHIYYGKQSKIVWKCKCDCGNYVNVVGDRLKSGMTKSCGCYNIERIKETKTHDLTGHRFGRLTVIEKIEEEHCRLKWKCLCDCGNETIVYGYNLRSGKTTSCGCYRSEYITNSHTTHGESHSRLYTVWQGMKDRCYRENDVSYYLYGARGIKVCDEWYNSYKSFRDWAIANGYDWNAPRGKCTLDRIDVNKDYCPENCRWVDMKIQSNNKRNNKKDNKVL